MSKEALNTVEGGFLETFNGKFFGVLRWHQLDVIWDAVKKESDSGWYIYQTINQPPQQLTAGDELNTFIVDLDKELRDNHEEDYCGIVYVDDMENPRFIKVFDPSNLGTSCSIATAAPLPKWIISKQLPEILATKEPQKKYHKRWFGNLFARK
jgi:hypothetical protein